MDTNVGGVPCYKSGKSRQQQPPPLSPSSVPKRLKRERLQLKDIIDTDSIVTRLSVPAVQIPPQRLVIKESHYNLEKERINGIYEVCGTHHGKISFIKKHILDLNLCFIYYWNEEDGPGYHGWWIGPVIGGAHPWYFHPSYVSETPPYIGWKVPFTHVIDPYMTISVVHPPPYKAEQTETRATIEKKPNKKPTMENCVTDKTGQRSAQYGSEEESHVPRSAQSGSQEDSYAHYIMCSPQSWPQKKWTKDGRFHHVKDNGRYFICDSCEKCYYYGSRIRPFDGQYVFMDWWPISNVFVPSKGCHMQRHLTPEQTEEAWKRNDVDVTWWCTSCWVNHWNWKGLTEPQMREELGILHKYRFYRTKNAATSGTAWNSSRKFLISSYWHGGPYRSYW